MRANDKIYLRPYKTRIDGYQPSQLVQIAIIVTVGSFSLTDSAGSAAEPRSLRMYDFYYSDNVGKGMKERVDTEVVCQDKLAIGQPSDADTEEKKLLIAQVRVGKAEMEERTVLQGMPGHAGLPGGVRPVGEPPVQGGPGRGGLLQERAVGAEVQRDNRGFLRDPGLGLSQVGSAQPDSRTTRAGTPSPRPPTATRSTTCRGRTGSTSCRTSPTTSPCSKTTWRPSWTSYRPATS
jgi:hypothetical protein